MTRVLVVDDGPAARDLARVLADAGHEVEVAAPPAKPPRLSRESIQAALDHCTDGAADLEEQLRGVFGPVWPRLGALLLALTVALAPTAAHAQDAGAPPPPGRAIELPEGTPAPYTGALVDRERMGAILARRWAAEAERDALRLSEQDARARLQQAERERDSRVGWGVLIGVTGAALVLGLVGGVVAVVAIQDRAQR